MVKSKRIFYLLIVFLSIIFLSSCDRGDVLLILNWGEYISEEVVQKFEEEYQCEVRISIADSNEAFYSKVRSGTTAYDLVVPSDYMIQKMYEKDLLQKLDLSMIPNYSEDIFLPGVIGIENGMFEGNENYHIPYFWGTFGLMYNKQKEGLEEIVKEKGWDAYFNPEQLPDNTKVGMYSVTRFAFAACMFYNHLDPNVVNDETIKIFQDTLKLQPFNIWGTDNLKKKIVANNLDLAFVYTGDCLDMLYTKLDDGVLLKDITFDIYIPNETIAFMDSLVMPKNARHKDLAYKFMNFMLEAENAYLNASVVGYCTPLIESYNMILDYKAFDISPIDEADEIWLDSWSYAMKTYYPIPKENEPIVKGTPLKNITNEELTRIDNIVNKVKTTDDE